MDPLLHAIGVIKEQVQDTEQRYDGYHVDLVRTLVEIIAKQDAGLSNAKRRLEVTAAVTVAGGAVATRRKG